MKIRVRNRQKALKISLKATRAIVRSVLSIERSSADEVTVHFVSPRAIGELHMRYFGDPSVTDCVSFPIDNDQDSSYQLLGDVIVCPIAAINYTASRGVSTYEETARYLIHGLLHLLGYDDSNPKDRAQMRRAERRHLQAIRNNGVMAAFSFMTDCSRLKSESVRKL